MKYNFKLSSIAASLAVIGGATFFSTHVLAATPLAGTNISNVATASYVDNTNTTRTVTSNEVKTVVAQVGSFTLVANRTAETTPNGKVEMSHILTNTGNGNDKFTIDLKNIDKDGTFEFGSGKFAVYLDKNKDGVPDDAKDLNGQSIELKAGEDTGLIVVATTPNTATKGQFDNLELTATAVLKDLYTESAITNKDKVTIVEGAVVSITKAASVNSVKVGKDIEYTLTFKNTGNAAATNVAIFDILPSNVTYVVDSAKYSGSANPLTDSNTDNDNYQFVADKKAVLLTIPVLAANTTGTLKFKVIVDAVKNINSVDNTAYVDPDGNNNTPYKPEDIPVDPSTKTDLTPSNESKVPLVSTHKGSLNDTSSNAFGDKETAVGGDDKIALTGQKDGVPVVFGASSVNGNEVVAHNSGDAVDTYNLTIDRTALAEFTGTKELPKGTIIEILKSDGATPATDTNGDGIVDTGPINPGESAKFIIRVTLPNGSVDTAGYSFLAQSTSVSGDKTVDTLKLSTGPITGNSVDLVNKPNKTTENGTGSGTDKPPVEEKTTPPGKTVEFDTTIKNTGNVPDNYVITVPNVPNDWTVEIFEKNGDTCSTTKVTNSGNVAPGTEKSFCVKVTPPAGSPAGTEQDIKVEIKSPSTGTSDTITYKVTVEQQRGLTFTPDRQGQVAPGGTVEYVHTLTNIGNVTEGAVSTLPNSRTPYHYPLGIDFSSTMSGVNTSIYVDLNNDGKADTSELVSGNTADERKESFAKLLATTSVAGTTNKEQGLSPKESIQIIVKVETPATATAGEKDTTILTFTPTGKGASNAVSITDLTTINLGQVRLSKTQAKTDSCGKTPADSAFGTANITVKPGECVYYRVTAVNDGNENAQVVKISDMVPSYTTYLENSIKPTTNTTAPTSTSNEVRYDVGTLTPSQTATLEFGVKVDVETKK